MFAGVFGIVHNQHKANKGNWGVKVETILIVILLFFIFFSI